jgi:putative (di)nucleoside polyphosphate hydrolase
MTDFSHLPYRLGVGIMLMNAQGQIWVGKRLDNIADAWQMPQGGVDAGEAPLAAALRELEEETGIAPALVSLIAHAPKTFFYDLPAAIQAQIWRGAYRGQEQHWFLYQYHGADSDVDIDTHEPEFSDWKWVAPSELPNLIVPFKRQLYSDILAAFAPHLTL